MKDKFTVHDGILIQKEHLLKWKKVLTPEAYNMLQMKCEAENVAVSRNYFADGTDVFRGQDLTEYIQNIIIAEIK